MFFLQTTSDQRQASGHPPDDDDDKDKDIIAPAAEAGTSVPAVQPPVNERPAATSTHASLARSAAAGP